MAAVSSLKCEEEEAGDIRETWRKGRERKVEREDNNPALKVLRQCPFILV
jgi:hypothetical protein